MAADRRIDAQAAPCIGDQRRIERLAHAVQALELEVLRRPAPPITLATVSALWVANCG